MKVQILLFSLLAFMGGAIPNKTTFHRCTVISGSGNHPHLFDVSEVYQCDEGKIEIAGISEKVIENGYVYSTELGRPSCERPYVATEFDYKSAKWCPISANQLKRCGDKPGICWDGKPGTWDSNWQGYSCVSPDHDGKKAIK